MDPRLSGSGEAPCSPWTGAPACRVAILLCGLDNQGWIDGHLILERE
jgi:hypothetical protein